MTELLTGRLQLRDWKATDEQDLIRIAGQAHIEHWLPDWREYDKHAKGWIEWAQRLYTNENPLDPFTSWAITLKDSGKLIGQILIGAFDKLGETEAGFGYFIDAAFSGNGYITEAVQAVARHAFDAYGYDHMVATIEPENLPSRRVAEKAGFVYIKTFEMLENGHDTVLPFCYYRLERPRVLEKMDSFFDQRADSYDDHMLIDLQLEEFYEAVDACFAGRAVSSLLDLGCGTGLELERMFRRFPGACITGVDLSEGMLARLREKYPARNLNLIRDSYFDVDLGINAFDHALSTYSLHHFSQAEKCGLYQKICTAIKPGGMFVLGDYTVTTLAQQEALRSEKERLYQENNANGAFLHFDTPFTAETEIELLQAAGFEQVKLVQQWEKTSIIIAKKGPENIDAAITLAQGESHV